MPKAHTLEEAKQIFLDNGKELLAKEYKNMRTSMPYICLKHKDKGVQYASLSNIVLGKGCKYCGAEKRPQNSAMDFEVIERACKDVGIELLSTKEDYKNRYSKLKYRCPHHPDVIQEITWNSLQQGAGCRLCGIEKRAKTQSYTYDFVKQAFEGRGYKLISPTYINCKEYLKYICPNHPDKIQKITFDAFIRGQGCYYCGIENGAMNRRVSIDRIRQKCKEVGIEYQGIDTSQGATRVLYTCPHHKEAGVRLIHWDALKMGCGCALCCESKGERKIANYLDSKGISYQREYKFKDCVDKRPLPFDFYINDLGIAIEYDGEQHFKPSTFGRNNEQEVQKTFVTTQCHDTIKTQYCDSHGIQLIRIPYWEQNNIEQILSKELNICKI